MRDGIAIDVSHVTKRFSLTTATGGSLKHLVVDAFRKTPRKTFQALTDVTFSVAKGETLGIIGRNGAGKSTLLSIIAGTMSPTEGTVETQGKISSLLELGAGFHPDLTGRENVFLYGSIMGIPRAVMQKRFDAIVDFAGIGEFIDQPVRFYSSGMYVRLGFAVAVQIDPDILLVDEVLAVGDADFQERCIERMNGFRQSGKTLLLISHDLGTIRAISDRIAILDHGSVVDIGSPGEMVEKYKNTIFAKETLDREQSEWGNRKAVLTKTEFLDKDFNPAGPGPCPDGILRVAVHFTSSCRLETPVFGFNLESMGAGNIFGSNTQLQHLVVPFVEKGDGRVIFEIDVSTLQRGRYQMSFSMHSSDHLVNYHRLEHVMPFHIDRPTGLFDGIVELKTKCHVVPQS